MFVFAGRAPKSGGWWLYKEFLIKNKTRKTSSNRNPLSLLSNKRKCSSGEIRKRRKLRWRHRHLLPGTAGVDSKQVITSISFLKTDNHLLNSVQILPG